ncbi:bifunctional 2-polyprenyl-6-hydroxyphenol methylase/3-demethylubiquinol 3-O-methyltransferase UbiG [Cohnella sp. AR92]|uniref:class I SAM-dependent methyltransferase n=1 Tax=Cohnella sp. AR92 TaxID=648716 RepID=UPI000F8EA390|nr:class I SAM-dependent methyltransferase [Cohnella sp. AR92]RUS45839.1 class I SAM-dependent methyltransferase [Cohnella sp. AR92]
MNKVVDYYTSFGDREWRRLDREPLEFIINMHYIRQYLPASGRILDNGAGPGKYTMELARSGYQVTLSDLTDKMVEIARTKSNELGLQDQFENFLVLNATELRGLSDEYFDASLMLGPLYHLQNEIDRSRAVAELNRVTKRNGTVFVAFRSRINQVINSLVSPEVWRPNNTIDEINRFIQSGNFNHSDEGRFTGAYFYNIEDINPFMEEHGFECIDLIGSTNIGTAIQPEQWEYWKSKGDYHKLIELLIRVAREPSVLGMSSHLLYVGRKINNRGI